jgi:hypothetical protein
MRIVPQSDPSGDFNEHTSPVMKQNTPRNEEEGKKNPSPTEIVLSERKVPDNDNGVPRRSSTMKKKLKNEGADNEGDEAAIVEDDGEKQMLAKAKLFFAALFSFGDMVTDIMMIVQYLQTRSLWVFAWASLGSLLTNLTFQALGTFTQNRTKPWQRQLKEQFYVWFLVKPGVDAWRVASGAAHEEGHVMDAQTELTMNKSIELVAEAIPGTSNCLRY